MKATMFRPLQSRSYRSLFTAQVFSDLGNWLDFVAIQVIVVYYWGLDETAIAAVIITLGLPWVVVGPFAGVFVDRLSPKKVMITCLILKTAFVGGLYFAPNLYVMLIFILLKSTVAALYDPARQSMIRSTVSEDRLPEAVTLSQLSVNTMKIAGPAFGGLLMGLFGTKSPFLVEAFVFIIAILCLIPLPHYEKQERRPSSDPKPDHSSFWLDFRTGIKHISTTKLLKTSIILSSISFFIIFMYDGLMIFVGQRIGLTPESFSLLISAVGFGSVMGALALGQWTQWRGRPIHLMSAALILSGFLIVAFGIGSMEFISVATWIWIVAAFILGVLASIESVPYGYILQSETPQHMMGRVSSTAAAMQTFSMLVAPAAGALLAKWWGVPYVLLGAGASISILGVYVLLFIVKKLGQANSNKARNLEA